MAICDQSEWPNLRWDAGALLQGVSAARFAQGELAGSLSRLSADAAQAAAIELLSEDLIRGAALDGEALGIDAIRDAVRTRLGDLPSAPADRGIDRRLEVMQAATDDLYSPLTESLLRAWQAAWIGPDAPEAGQLRGAASSAGRSRSPVLPADRISAELDRFCDWFNARGRTEGLVRAGAAHLWLSAIEPFGAGNGAIIRAVTDRALAQSLPSPRRLFSLTRRIRQERLAYLAHLSEALAGGIDITAWLDWFLGLTARAIAATPEGIGATLRKTAFWQERSGLRFTDREIETLSAIIDSGETRVTAKLWAEIGDCSIATAQRDIIDMVARGILARNPGGSKNTSYTLVL